MNHSIEPRAGIGLMSAACSLLLLSAAPLRAAQDGDPVGKLEEIVVTANRTGTPRESVGSTVTVVERSTIDDRRAVHGGVLLQDVPGLAVSRLGGHGAQTQVRVRGAEANQVLVLIDGVKANDPAGSDEFDFGALTLHDVERMEIVRGPQSALWGSEAAAGVINVTTRQAEEPLTASGFLEGGSRGTVYTGLSLGSGGSRGGLILNTAFFDTRGESAATAGREKDGYRNLTVGLNGRWKPNEDLRFAFASRYSDVDADYDDVDFTTGLPADADLLSRNTRLTLMTEAGLTAFDERWDQTVRVTWLDTDRDQRRDGGWESSTAAEKLGVYYQSTLSFAPASQRLIAALDYEDETFEQRGFVGFADPNQKQDRRKLGAVAEYLLAPLAGLDLGGSVRFDDNSDFRDVSTYRFTASYGLAGTRTRLRGSYGTGHKAPTFVEQFGFYPDSFTGNPDLKPERTRGFDLGVEQGFGRDRWRVGLTYFSERLTDEIVTTFDPVSFLATPENLSGRSSREGVEISLDGSVTESLQVSASYTHVDAEQPDGTAEIRRPRHMASANVDYRLLAGRAGINVNLSYSGTQRDTIYPPPSYAPQTLALSDHLLVDLSGRLRVSERLEVYVRAENVFDEHYTEVAGYRSPGRSVHLGLRYGGGR